MQTSRLAAARGGRGTGRAAHDRGSEQTQWLLERAGAQALVAAKRNRPAQTLLDLAKLLASAHKQGWALVALEATPAGQASANVRATFAPCEPRLISERTRMALARARSQGVRLGRPPTMPAHVIERIRRERAAGNSLAAIANGLNAEDRKSVV